MCLPSAFDSHFCSLSVSLSLFSSLCLSFALTIFCGLSDFHSCSLSISHFFPLSIFLLLSSTLSDFLTPLPLPLLSADFCARPKATDSAQSQSCDTKAVEGRGTLMSVDGAEDLSEVPLTGYLSLFETSSRVRMIQGRNRSPPARGRGAAVSTTRLARGEWMRSACATGPYGFARNRSPPVVLSTTATFPF